jgi:hypothetical protein
MEQPSSNVPKVTVSNPENETNEIDAQISPTDEPATEVRKRVKVALTPGHTQVDWFRLNSTGNFYELNC